MVILFRTVTEALSVEFRRGTLRKTYLRYLYQGVNFFFRTLACSSAGHGVAGPAAILLVLQRDRVIFSVWGSAVWPYHPTTNVAFLISFQEQDSCRTAV